MSAVLEFYRRLVVSSGDANLLDFGSIVAPQKAAAVAGVPRHGPQTITLAAGASRKLWAYTDDGAFALFVLECSGFLWVAEKVDAPVSGSDHTAAGTAVNFPKTGISCNAPLVLQGMDVPVAASSTNYASAAWHASVAAGRRYEVWVKNPSATDAVDVTWLWTL